MRSTVKMSADALLVELVEFVEIECGCQKNRSIRVIRSFKKSADASLNPKL